MTGDKGLLILHSENMNQIATDCVYGLIDGVYIQQMLKAY